MLTKKKAYRTEQWIKQKQKLSKNVYMVLKVCFIRVPNDPCCTFKTLKKSYMMFSLYMYYANYYHA